MNNYEIAKEIVRKARHRKYDMKEAKACFSDLREQESYGGMTDETKIRCIDRHMKKLVSTDMMFKIAKMIFEAEDSLRESFPCEAYLTVKGLEEIIKDSINKSNK